LDLSASESAFGVSQKKPPSGRGKLFCRFFPMSWKRLQKKAPPGDPEGLSEETT